MAIDRKVETAALLGPILIAAAVFGLLPIPDGNELWKASMNAAHAPFFALLVAAVVRISWLWLGRDVPLPIHLLIAAGLACAIGVASEAAQYFLPRDASIWDLVRDLIGITAGLLGSWTVASSARLSSRLITVIAVFGLLGVTTLPLLSVVSAYSARNAAFPEIAVLPAPASLRFHEFSSARATYVDGRIDVTYLPDRDDFPRFEILEVEPDWKDATQLVAEVTNHSVSNVRLHLRINDGRHSGTYSDRFNAEFALVEGFNRLSIPLANVWNGPENRVMSLEDVRTVIFFVVRPKDEIKISFESVRLEYE